MFHGWRMCALSFCLAALACGPVVHRAPTVTVTNPIYQDPEYVAFSIIARKDMRAGRAHKIVGQRQHIGEGVIEEYVEIVFPQGRTWGDDLHVEVGVCSQHPNGLDFADDYRATLHVANRPSAQGDLRQTWKMLDLTEKTSGAGLYPHQTVRTRDASGKVTVQRLYHVEEHENVTELYCRRARYKFAGDPLFDQTTAWIEFVLDGDQRRRIWRFKLKPPNQPSERPDV